MSKENARGMQDDTISRQEAIDALENDKSALDKIIKGMSAEDMLLKYYVAQHNQVSYDIDAIVQLPPIQPADNLQKLADEIASFKRRVKSENSDYLTGYLCALSVVEGMIADMREVNNEGN